MMKWWISSAVFVSVVVLSSQSALSEEVSATETKSVEADGPNDGKAKAWNEFDGKHLTARFGFGLLIDTANYLQDDVSEIQMPQNSAVQLRDFRLLLRGKFKFAPRIRYTLGYMYDGANDVWRFRQTGLIFELPELNGELFVGRTKEGFSTSKIMVGYNGWTNERAAANDAFLPILADGFKFTGRGFDGKFVYNLGWFSNAFVRSAQSYVKNDEQVTARAVWLPFSASENKTLLHLAVEGRHGLAKNGKQQYRSKPESFPAQSYAVDTGVFPANSSRTLGLEAYFRPGSLMFGSEYFWNKVDAPSVRDPLFQGGEIFIAYIMTGEIRPYNEKGAYFEMIKPLRSIVDGGGGAVEAVLRYSYVDLNSGDINGGRFKRITPMINWYMTENVRLEIVYGYSSLERFEMTGKTQYFQSRIQIQL